jgi:hypothetical protein
MKTAAATLTFVLCAVTSCVDSSDEDGRDDSFTGDDKADSGGVAEGSRQAKGVLRVANEVSLETLRASAPDGVGLSDRTVDNIGDVRLGDDGLPGTADDGRFATLAQLDAVPFVGPIAFHKLLAYAEANGFVPHGTIINGTADVPTSLVAYREGFAGDWQPATMKSPTSFEIEVDGPYTLVAVCEDATGGVTEVELGQLPDEGAVEVGCGPFGGPAGHTLTGHMAQAGRVVAGVSSQSSSTADWDFSLAVADGTYDVVASTADAIAVRRNVVVAGDQALAQVIDVAAEQLPQVTIPLTAANVEAGESVSARVTLRPQTNLVSGIVFSGAPANARIILPSSLLATDRQRASITAKQGNFQRSLTRGVAAGADPSFMLPPHLDNPQWTVDNGELQLRLASLPAANQILVDASASSADFSKSWFYSFSMSDRFAAQSGLTHVTLDTNIPGFKPEWLIDFSAEYSREVFAFGDSPDDFSTSQFSETVNGASGKRAGDEHVGEVVRGGDRRQHRYPQHLLDALE